MPRETVQHARVDADSTEVSVHWGRNTHVQMHLERHTPGDSSVTHFVEDIWTDVMSRNQINELIRVLRRARNQAYGGDE